MKGKNANTLGIYDMTGNVFEWCYDWNSNITSSTGASGAVSGSKRVARGGGWSYYEGGCKVSFRDYNYPSNRYNYLGFRLVRTVTAE